MEAPSPPSPPLPPVDFPALVDVAPPLSPAPPAAQEAIRLAVGRKAARNQLLQKRRRVVRERCGYVLPPSPTLRS